MKENQITYQLPKETMMDRVLKFVHYAEFACTEKVKTVSLSVDDMFTLLDERHIVIMAVRNGEVVMVNRKNVLDLAVYVEFVRACRREFSLFEIIPDKDLETGLAFCEYKEVA